jgi:hypothetical protein
VAEAPAEAKAEPEAQPDPEAEVAEQQREPLPSRPVQPAARLVPRIAPPFPREQREPRQAPPAGQPAPFVPEVPVAGEVPPPLDRPVTPAAAAAMGVDPDGTLDRPMFTNWPPSLRTEADPPAVPPFLAGQPQAPPGAPPQPGRQPGHAIPPAAFERPLRPEQLGQPLPQRPGAPGGQVPPPLPGHPLGPGQPSPSDTPPEFTADGLVKRVPGARLAAGLQSSRPRQNGGASEGFEAPVPDARRQHASSMLSRFQSAQRDARAAATETPEEPPQEEEPS